jgi:hypothetical protein
MGCRKLVCLMFVALVMSAGSALARDRFEGKWKLTLLPDPQATAEGAKQYEDTVTFGGLKFESAELKKQGFGPVDYESDTRGITGGTFKAEQKSDSAGTAQWDGHSASGQELRGTLKITKPNGNVVHYDLQGVKE